MIEEFDEKQYDKDSEQEIHAMTFLRISTKIATTILRPSIVNVSCITKQSPKEGEPSFPEYTEIELVNRTAYETNINGNVIAPWDYNIGVIHVYGDEISFFAPRENGEECPDLLFLLRLEKDQVALIDLEDDGHTNYTIIVNTMDKESAEVLLNDI